MTKLTAITPYVEPVIFQPFEESPDYPLLINRNIPANVWDQKQEKFTQARVRINQIGAVHLSAVKANENRLRSYDYYVAVGRQWPEKYSLPIWFYNARDDFWFRVILPRWQMDFLVEVANGGDSGLIFSGDHPQSVKNDGRKWISSIRQLGIPVSTAAVPESLVQHGHRYTLHAEFRNRLPKGSSEKNLYMEALHIVGEFHRVKSAQIEERRAANQENLVALCSSFPKLYEQGAGA